MKHRPPMAHYVGGFILGMMLIALYSLSLMLSFKMFSSIAPADLPWFTPAAMSLTDIGLAGWMAVFILMRHHPFQKTIALFMVIACAFTAIFTDAVELANLFHANFVLSNLYFGLIIVMVCAHMVAGLLEGFSFYFSRPGNTFWANECPTYEVTAMSQTDEMDYNREMYVQPEYELRQRAPGALQEGHIDRIPAHVVRTTAMPAFMAAAVSRVTGKNFHGAKCRCTSCRVKHPTTNTILNAVEPEQPLLPAASPEPLQEA